MASVVRCTVQWPCLVKRQYRKILCFSQAQRKIHITGACAVGSHMQRTCSYWHKYSHAEPRRISKRIYSTETNNAIDYGNIGSEIKQEKTLSQQNIENVITSEHPSMLSSNAQPAPKGYSGDAGNSDQDMDTIEIPSDLTEKEFIEVAKDWELEKYAKTVSFCVYFLNRFFFG